MMILPLQVYGVSENKNELQEANLRVGKDLSSGLGIVRAPHRNTMKTNTVGVG
jgi:hypothetical protein